MCQSTGASERISCVFYVTVNLDPEVDSRFAWNSGFPRAPCIWQSLPAVLMLQSTEAFGRFLFFYVKVDLS